MSKWEYLPLFAGIFSALMVFAGESIGVKFAQAILAAINLTVFVYWRDKREV